MEMCGGVSWEQRQPETGGCSVTELPVSHKTDEITQPGRHGNAQTLQTEARLRQPRSSREEREVLHPLHPGLHHTGGGAQPVCWSCFLLSRLSTSSPTASRQKASASRAGLTTVKHTHVVVVVVGLGSR